MSKPPLLLITTLLLALLHLAVAEPPQIALTIDSSWVTGSLATVTMKFLDDLPVTAQSALFDFNNYPTTLCPITSDRLTPRVNLGHNLQCYVYYDAYGNLVQDAAARQHWVGQVTFPACSGATTPAHMEFTFTPGDVLKEQMIRCYGRVTNEIESTYTVNPSVRVLNTDRSTLDWTVAPNETNDDDREQDVNKGHQLKPSINRAKDMELSLKLNTTGEAQVSFDGAQVFPSLVLDVKNLPNNYMAEINIGYRTTPPPDASSDAFSSQAEQHLQDQQDWQFDDFIFNDLMMVLQAKSSHEVFNWPFPFPMPVIPTSNALSAQPTFPTQTDVSANFGGNSDIPTLQLDGLIRDAKSSLFESTSLHAHHYEQFYSQLLQKMTLMFTHAQINRAKRLKTEQPQHHAQFQHQDQALMFASLSAEEQDLYAAMGSMGGSDDDLSQESFLKLFPQLANNHLFQNSPSTTETFGELSNPNLAQDLSQIPPHIAHGLKDIFTNFFRENNQSNHGPSDTNNNPNNPPNSDSASSPMTVQAPSPIPDFSRFNPNQLDWTKYRYSIQCGRQVRLYVTPMPVQERQATATSSYPKFALYLVTGASPPASAQCSFPVSLTRLFYQHFSPPTPFTERPYFFAPTLRSPLFPARPPSTLSLTYAHDLEIALFFKDTPNLPSSYQTRVNTGQFTPTHPAISPSSHLTASQAVVKESSDGLSYQVSQTISGIGNVNNVLKLKWLEGSIKTADFYDNYVASWTCLAKNDPRDTGHTIVTPKRTTDGMELEIRNPTPYFYIQVSFSILKTTFQAPGDFVPFAIHWEMQKRAQLLSTPTFDGILNTFPQFTISLPQPPYKRTFTNTTLSYRITATPTIVDPETQEVLPIMQKYSKTTLYYQEFALLLDYGANRSEFRSPTAPYPTCKITNLTNQNENPRISVKKLPSSSYSAFDRYYLLVQGRFMIQDQVVINCDQLTHVGKKAPLFDNFLSLTLHSRYFLGSQQINFRAPNDDERGEYEANWNVVDKFETNDNPNGVYVVSIDSYDELYRGSKNYTISRVISQLQEELAEEIDFEVEPYQISAQNTFVSQDWVRQVHGIDAKHDVSKIGSYGSSMKLLFKALRPRDPEDVAKRGHYFHYFSPARDYMLTIDYVSVFTGPAKCNVDWNPVSADETYPIGCPVPLGQPCYSSAQCQTSFSRNNDISVNAVCIQGVCTLDQPGIGATTFSQKLQTNQQSVQSSSVYPYFTTRSSPNIITGYSMSNTVLFDDQGLDDDGIKMGDNAVTLQGQINCSLGECPDVAMDLELEMTLPCDLPELTSVVGDIYTYTDLSAILEYENADKIDPISDTITLTLTPPTDPAQSPTYVSQHQLKVDPTLNFSPNIFFMVKLRNLGADLLAKCPAGTFDKSDKPHFTGIFTLQGFRSKKMTAMVLKPLSDFKSIVVPQPERIPDQLPQLTPQADITIHTFNLNATSQATIYPDIDLIALTSKARMINTLRLNAYVDEVHPDLLPLRLETSIYITLTGLWQTETIIGGLLSPSLCYIHGIEGAMVPMTIDDSGAEAIMIVPVRPAFYTQNNKSVFQQGFQFTCDFTINSVGQNYIKLQHLFKTNQIGFNVMVKNLTCLTGLVECYRLLPYQLHYPYPEEEQIDPVPNPDDGNNDGRAELINVQALNTPTPMKRPKSNPLSAKPVTHLEHVIRPMWASDTSTADSFYFEPLDFNFKTSSFSFVRNINTTIFVPKEQLYNSEYGLDELYNTENGSMKQYQSRIESQFEQLHRMTGPQSPTSPQFTATSSHSVEPTSAQSEPLRQSPQLPKTRKCNPITGFDLHSDHLDELPEPQRKPFITPIEKTVSPVQILDKLAAFHDSHQSTSPYSPHSTTLQTQPSQQRNSNVFQTSQLQLQPQHQHQQQLLQEHSVFEAQDIDDEDSDGPSGTVAKTVFRSFLSYYVQYPSFQLNANTFTTPGYAGIELIITSAEEELVKFAQYWVNCKTWMKIGQPTLHGVFALKSRSKAVNGGIPVVNYVLSPERLQEVAYSVSLANQESCSLRVSVVFEAEHALTNQQLPIPLIFMRTQERYRLERVNKDGYHYNATVSMMYQPDYSRTLESSLLKNFGYQTPKTTHPEWRSPSNMKFSATRVPSSRAIIAYDQFSVALRINTDMFKGNATHFNWELVGGDFSWFSTWQGNNVLLYSCSYSPWGEKMIDELYAIALSPTSILFNKSVLHLTNDTDIYCGLGFRTNRVTQIDNRPIIQVTAFSEQSEVAMFSGYMMGPDIDTYSRKPYTPPFWTFSTVIGVLFGFLGVSLLAYVIFFIFKSRQQRKRMLEDRKTSLITLRETIEQQNAEKLKDAYWNDSDPDDATPNNIVIEHNAKTASHAKYSASATTSPVHKTATLSPTALTNNQSSPVQELFHIPTEPSSPVSRR